MTKYMTLPSEQQLELKNKIRKFYVTHNTDKTDRHATKFADCIFNLDDWINMVRVPTFIKQQLEAFIQIPDLSLEEKTYIEYVINKIQEAHSNG